MQCLRAYEDRKVTKGPVSMEAKAAAWADTLTLGNTLTRFDVATDSGPRYLELQRGKAMQKKKANQNLLIKCLREAMIIE